MAFQFSIKTIKRLFDHDFRKRFRPFLISAILCWCLFQSDLHYHSLASILYMTVPLISFTVATLRSLRKDINNNRDGQGGILGIFTLLWIGLGVMLVLGWTILADLNQFRFSIFLQVGWPVLAAIMMGFVSSGVVVRSVFKRAYRNNFYQRFQVELITVACIVVSVGLWGIFDEILMVWLERYPRLHYQGGTNPFLLSLQRPIHILGFAIAAWQIAVGAMLSITDKQEKELAKIEMIGSGS